MANKAFTYQDYTVCLDAILDQIRAKGAKYDLVVALLRGGALPAVALSHALKASLKTVEWGRSFQLADLQLKCEMSMARRVLVVDDLLDSGGTMQSFLEKYGPCDIACLIWNTEQPLIPTYYGMQIQRSVTPEWFDFFWETPHVEY